MTFPAVPISWSEHKKPTHHASSIQPTITLIPHIPKHGSTVTMELGNGYAVPSASGGWGSVARPRRKGATTFQGYDPTTEDVPVVLGDYDHDNSQEAAINRLYQMMQEKVGDDEQPAVLRITGMPIPFRSRLWVLNGISRGEELRRASDGHITRAELTLSLMEFVDEDVLVKDSSAKKVAKKNHGGFGGKQSLGGGGPFGGKQSLGGGTGPTNVYVTKKGDTLEKIAAKVYGKAKEWHKIADANNLHDGGKKLKPGLKLKIPK